MISLNDHINILSKLTPGKILNFIRLFVSFYFSKWMGKPIQRGFPASIAIEPTTHCNLRCPECPSGLRSFTRPTGMMDFDLYKRIIDELHGHLIYLTLYFQGEPFLHPRFFDMVRYASGKKIYTSTSTNAHYLDDQSARNTVKSGLDRLIISIDGTTQDVYAAYRRGGRLSRVIDGTKNIVRLKRLLKSRTPHLIFQFLVVRPNEHQVDEVRALGKELGVNEVRFKTAQIYGYHNGNPLIPLDEKFSRYRRLDDGTYAPKNPMMNQCWRLWQSCVFTWDGRIVPCCFDKDAAHSMGILNGTSFKEIWENEHYRRFRTAILQSRKKIDICKNCTEGMSVWS